jgi:hypothetical protein
MRASKVTHDITRDGRIVAPPPFDPKRDLKQPLPVSRTRVRIGLVLVITGFAVGSSGSLFPAAKIWLGGVGLLLIISSFFILGLHRLRSHGRHPRKLYEHDLHLTSR